MAVGAILGLSEHFFCERFIFKEYSDFKPTHFSSLKAAAMFAFLHHLS